jgi:hypothetical protein
VCCPAADEECPDPAASAGHHQVTHGLAVSEGHHQVTQDPAANEEHYGPAVSGGCHQVTQGPGVNEEHCQAIHGLPEEEEESTGSEDENGGSACENMQDIASKNGMHLGPAPFKDLQHQVLMESAGPSPISSDRTPTFLCDHPKLCTACAKLTAGVDNKGLNLIMWW